MVQPMLHQDDGTMIDIPVTSATSDDLSLEGLQMLFNTLRKVHDHIEEARSMIDNTVTIQRMKKAGLTEECQKLASTLEQLQEDDLDFMPGLVIRLIDESNGR